MPPQRHKQARIPQVRDIISNEKLRRLFFFYVNFKQVEIRQVVTQAEKTKSVREMEASEHPEY